MDTSAGAEEQTVMADKHNMPTRARNFIAPFFADLPITAQVTASYIREFAQLTPLNSGITVSTSLILAAALWPTAPKLWLVSWLAVHFYISTLLFVRWWKRRNRPARDRVSVRGLRKAKIWGLLSGALWGSTVVFMPLVSQTQQMVIVIVCGAMAAGGTATLAAIPQAAALFILATIGPFAVHFALQGDPVSFTLSALALLMIVGMLGSARVIYGSFIQQAKTKQENINLLKEIQAERQEWIDFSEGSEAFALYDEDNHLLLWNETFEHMFGIPKTAVYRGMAREDVLRMAVKSVTVGELGLNLNEWIDHRLKATDQPSSASLHKMENGRWIQSVSRRTRSGHMAVVNVDITALKETEEALRSSETKLRAAQKMARVGSWEWDAQSGDYVCSEQLLDLFGFDLSTPAISPDQFINSMHPEDRSHAVSVIAELKEKGLPGCELRFRIKQPDGNVIHVLSSVRAIKDSAGNFAGSSGTVQDVTEFVKTQEALKERETRLQGVMDGVPDGIIAIDENGQIESFNPAAEELFGYSAPEMVGKNVTTLMSETDAAYHNDHLDRHRRTGEASVLGAAPREVEGIRKDGSLVPIELSVSDVKLGGSKLFIGVVRDISERKETEERLLQAQKMEAVGQLTGGVAHDFNNMLAVVTGNLELLGEYAEVAEEAELVDLLESAVDAAKRGAELTRRLLAFSRRQALKSQPTDLNALIDGMLGLVRRTLGENIEILFDPPKEPMHAEIDPAQLESAFLNLAINSRDAMLMGGTVSIKMEAMNVGKPSARKKNAPTISPGKYVVLKVTDTGSGMSKDVLDKVFEPFFTTKPVGEGTGLGLSMVYGFIKQSGGHVAIDSKVGKGTTVSLYLPWSDKPIADLRSSNDASLASMGKGQTVLIVEDDAAVRKLVVSLIRSLGYEVIESMDANSALELIDATPKIDLMFTDVILGKGMNGVDLGREAMKRRQDIKVLYTSGYAESAIFDDRWRREGIELINKPYRKAELAKKLSETLSEAVE